MKICFTDACPRFSHLISQVEIEDALKFYLEYLKIPQYVRQYLEITIDMDPNNAYAGLCVPLGDDYRDFVITINPAASDILTVLAHEVVHLKQLATYEMVDTMEGTMWKTILHYPVDANVDIKGHFEAPWEIEAYALQDEMTKAWLAK